MRVVHGVVNKMDNGRKKFAKKVVRRAVRRAGKAVTKLSGECLELAAKYFATSNLCTLDMALDNSFGRRVDGRRKINSMRELERAVDRAVDIAIEGAMEGMAMDEGDKHFLDRYETKAIKMVEAEIKSFRSDLKAGGKRAAYWIETLNKEIPFLCGSPSDILGWANNLSDQLGKRVTIRALDYVENGVLVKPGRSTKPLFEGV